MRGRIAIASLLLVMAGWCWAASDASTSAPAKPVPQNVVDDDCFSARGGVEKGHIGLAFARKVRDVFQDEPAKIDALLYAFPRACRTYLITLAPTPALTSLLHTLQNAREEYEATGAVSETTIKALDQQGVHKKVVPVPQGRPEEWQLVMDGEAYAKLKIQAGADLASNGNMFIEAYYQLLPMKEFAQERKVFLEAIEKTSREIMDHSDENADGIVGWGRLWFKGRDGRMLHWTNPTQNMYFGGYTVYPRVDALGKRSCEPSLPLREETFDHAYNDLFLLETYLLTRDHALAERIIRLVGKSFDDTFDNGGPAGPAGTGWYYWKQLGKTRGTALPSCEVGREIKNTNLAMGVSLRLYAEILRRNAGDAVLKDAGLMPETYLARAEQVLATNNWEVFSNNNFGYEGVHSRNMELTQNPSLARLMYDRTQKEVSLDAPFLLELKSVITAGNKVAKRETPPKTTICSGDIDAPGVDRSSGGSCWNHLAFEAESYFRLMRYGDLWSAKSSAVGQRYLDAMVRNLAATNLVLDGRTSRYAHYFPGIDANPSSNEAIEVAVFGYFCMARKLAELPSVQSMPKVDQTFLKRASAICNSAPKESAGNASDWRRGYKFHQLVLSADRLRQPADDWLLSGKVPASPVTPK